MALDLANLFTKSATGRKMLAEVEAQAETERLARRQEFAAQRQAELTRRETEAKRLRTAAEKARTAVLAAGEALKTAQQEAGRAHAAVLAASATHQSVLARIEGALHATAAPCIDALIAELRGRCDRLIGGNEATTWMSGTRWEGNERVHSNHASIAACMVALRTGIEGAEALKLEALAGDELAQRLEALERSIPAIEQAPAVTPEGASR